jgi:hypothetical protein
MLINSVSNMRALMEEKFCSLLPSLAMNTSDKIAVQMVMGLVDYEIEIYEELLSTAVSVRDRPKKDDDGSDIMQAYYLGEKATHNARIRRYKTRITQLKKIKEQFYEKVT